MLFGLARSGISYSIHDSAALSYNRCNLQKGRYICTARVRQKDVFFSPLIGSSWSFLCLEHFFSRISCSLFDETSGLISARNLYPIDSKYMSFAISFREPEIWMQKILNILQSSIVSEAARYYFCSNLFEEGAVIQSFITATTDCPMKMHKIFCRGVWREALEYFSNGHSRSEAHCTAILISLFARKMCRGRASIALRCFLIQTVIGST